MRRTSLFLAVILALLLAACRAIPDDNLKQIQQTGKLLVGTSADYPPFEWRDDAGELTGFDIALIREIGKRMHVTIEIVDMPFDELIPEVEAGTINLAISAFNYSEARDARIDFTDPYYYERDAIVVAEEFEGEIYGPTQLVNHIVGVQAGTIQESWLEEHLVEPGDLAAANVVHYARTEEMGAALQSGDVNAVLMGSVGALNLSEDMGGLRIAYEGAISGGPINIVIPEGDTALAAALNKVIAELQAEGFIDRLVIDYIR